MSLLYLWIKGPVDGWMDGCACVKVTFRTKPSSFTGREILADLSRRLAGVRKNTTVSIDVCTTFVPQESLHFGVNHIKDETPMLTVTFWPFKGHVATERCKR